MLKNSKIVKGFVVVALSASLLIPSAAFAGTDDLDGGLSKENGRPVFSKIKDIYETAKKDHSRLLNLVEKYAAEDLDKWNAVFEEQKELREELKELHEQVKEIRAYKKEELKDYREELKAKVEEEDMTKEEAKEEFKSYIEEIKAGRSENKEELKEKFQERREELQEKREEIKEVRGSLKEAVEQEDTEKINDILDEIYNNALERIDFLKEKVEVVKERLEEVE